MKLAATLAALCLIASLAQAQTATERSKEPTNCAQFHINQKGTQALHQVKVPPSIACKATAQNGKFVPDPSCTPGAINPSVTESVLKNPAFRTGCIRDEATTEEQKTATYDWYKTAHPSKNTGQNQTCELDHLIPLYLGGADTLDNIWPQCGPDNVALDDRYFKEKDKVEYYLGQQVREGNIGLAEAQNGIATDWTQYISKAAEFCRSGKCEFRGQ
jgi:5-methylcytosine-specific restriction endonuclease McrA